MMMTMASEQMTQATRLMEIMMVGREATPAPEPPPRSSNGPPTEFDYDSTPLSAGIEGVLAREVEEDQLAVLQRERAALQERMRELQEEQRLEQDRSTLEDSSPGPWTVPSADSPSPM